VAESPTAAHHRTGINQLWIADLTYIRLLAEFVFLAAIQDAFSRRVIGWVLDRSLDDQLTLSALRMALARRTPLAALVHHSDRGSQYASRDYTELLQAKQIRISMSRKGNPWNNAACESFMKTLKYEEVYRNEYRDLTEAHAAIGKFLKRSTTRNACTRRWAMCRRPSSRRDRQPRIKRPLRGSFLMSFPRHREISKSNEGSATLGAEVVACPHGSSASMSFQLAIPWRVALQQRLPPLRQPEGSGQ
jgi:hypothetical protein